MGVADAQPRQQLVPATLVETLVSFEQQLADAKKRVDLAPPVPERLVLDPPAHLVEHAVGDPSHMEGIGHPGGVGEVRVRARRGRCRSGRGPRPGRPCSQCSECPAHHRRSLAALFPSNRSITMRRSRSTREVA